MPEGTVPDPPVRLAAITPPASPPDRKKRALVVAGVVTACVLGGAAKLLAGRGTVTSDDALVVARTVHVSPEVAAKVRKVHVREHQRVERGALLVELDPTFYENALARANGELHAAEALVRQAEVRAASVQKQRPMMVLAARGEHAQAMALHASLEAEVRRAEAQATSAAASLSLARQEQARVASLRKGGSVSDAEVEQAAAKVAALEADLASANAQIAAAKMRRTAAGGAERSADGRASLVETSAEEAQAAADLALANARVEEARASVARADAELARTKIVAPFAGIVEHVTVEDGSTAAPGGDVLSVVSTEDVWVEVRVKETEVERLGDGQRASVQVDALGGRTLRGHVDGVGHATLARFSAIPSEATGAHFVRVTQRVPVRVVLEDRPAGLRAGLNAVVSVDAAGK